MTNVQPRRPLAFPLVHEITPEKGNAKAFSVDFGMTLRDYFAAKAMQAIASRVGELSRDQAAEPINGDICQLAYELADAMIKEREKS